MKTLKICCIADLHGYFPPVPECDLLLLAGDYSPAFKHKPVTFFREQFKPWVDEAAKHCKVIGIAGNHEEFFEDHPHLIPEMDWEYLQDSGTTFQGINIWGTPWTPYFYDWAFNATEEELEEKWALIPENTDILLVHGPPNGYADFVDRQEHVGSPSLLRRIQEIKPRLVVAGHIHSGYGSYQIGDTYFVSVSLVNERYHPVNEVRVIDYEFE